MKINRRKSREIAFTLLFEWSFREEELDDILADAAEGRGLEVDDFARSLLETAVFNRSHIDNCIEKYSTDWKINRLSRVTLSVLRLSLCELMYFEDIPVGATINEAVELVKAYASAEEAAFVNGVLGTFERERGQEPEQEPEPELEQEPEQDVESEQEPELEQGFESEQEPGADLEREQALDSQGSSPADAPQQADTL